MWLKAFAQCCNKTVADSSAGQSCVYLLFFASWLTVCKQPSSSINVIINGGFLRECSISFSLTAYTASIIECSIIKRVKVYASNQNRFLWPFRDILNQTVRLVNMIVLCVVYWCLTGFLYILNFYNNIRDMASPKAKHWRHRVEEGFL